MQGFLARISTSISPASSTAAVDGIADVKDGTSEAIEFPSEEDGASSSHR